MSVISQGFSPLICTFAQDRAYTVRRAPNVAEAAARAPPLRSRAAQRRTAPRRRAHWFKNSFTSSREPQAGAPSPRLGGRVRRPAGGASSPAEYRSRASTLPQWRTWLQLQWLRSSPLLRRTLSASETRRAAKGPTSADKGRGCTSTPCLPPPCSCAVSDRCNTGPPLSAAADGGRARRCGCHVRRPGDGEGGVGAGKAAGGGGTRPLQGRREAKDCAGPEGATLGEPRTPRQGACLLVAPGCRPPSASAPHVGCPPTRCSRSRAKRY